MQGEGGVDEEVLAAAPDHGGEIVLGDLFDDVTHRLISDVEWEDLAQLRQAGAGVL